MLKRRFRTRSRLARPDFTSAHTRLHLREALHGQFLQQRLLRMSAVGFPLFGPSGSERAAVPQARLRSFIVRAEREARRRGRTLVPCAREVSYFVRTVPRGPLARPGWALWAFGQEGCLGSRGLRQCVCVPRDSGAAEDGQGPGEFYYSSPASFTTRSAARTGDPAPIRPLQALYPLSEGGHGLARRPH